MALTPGITPQSTQNLATAAQGMMHQDKILEAENARKDAANQRKMDREDAMAKLKMSHMHQTSMQDTQIKSDENIQSNQFAENLKSREFGAGESEKQREFVGEQNRISQELELFFDKARRDSARKTMEWETKIWGTGNGYGRGGGGTGAGGSGQLGWAGGTGGPATSGRSGFGGTSPGIYLTPEEWREQKLESDNQRIEFGDLYGTEQLKLVRFMNEQMDVSNAYDNYLGNITTAWQNTMEEKQQMVGIWGSPFASEFNAGGNLMKHITETDASRMGGMTPWMNSWNRFVGGGFGEIVPVTPGDSIDNHYFADVRGNDKDLKGAIEVARGNAYEAAYQMAKNTVPDLSYADFDKGYIQWRDANDFHSLEETNAGKSSDASGFNQMIAFEVLDGMGTLNEDQQNTLEGYRSSFGNAQENPILSGDVSSLGGYGQGNVPAFTAASEENMVINMINGLTTNLRDMQGYAEQADVIDQIAPLLINHLYSGQMNDDKTRKEVTDKIVKILGDNKGTGYNAVIVMADRFIGMANEAAGASFGQDTKDALTASDARPDQINEMVNATETAYTAVGKVGGLIHNLLGGGKGGNKDAQIQQGMIQSVIKDPEIFGGMSPWTGEIEVVQDRDGTAHEVRTLNTDWMASVRASLYSSDAFKNMTPEVKDMAFRLILEEAQTMSTQIDPVTGRTMSKTVEQEMTEATTARETYETAEKARETYFDETIMPSYRGWEERGQTGYEDRMDQFFLDRETMDQDMYNRGMDIINQRRGAPPTSPSTPEEDPLLIS